MVNEEGNHIIHGEFKWTLDTSEKYYDDMKRRADVKHCVRRTFDTDKRDSIRIIGRLCHTLLFKSLNYATGSTCQGKQLPKFYLGVTAI